MRRTSKTKRVPADFPQDARRQIDVTLAMALPGKGAYEGETLVDLVRRHCPDIYQIAEREGFSLTFSLPENTQAALKRGELAYVVRRMPIH